MTSPTIDRRLGLTGSTAYKAPATAIATANIVQSGEQTIDGVACLAANAAGVPDRVLCTGMSDATKNGLFDVGTGSWTRSIDANGNSDLVQGSQVLVTKGSHANQIWLLTTADPITIGSTALAFSQSLAAGFLATLAASGGAALVGRGAGTVESALASFNLLTDFASYVVGGNWAPALTAALAVGSVIVPGDATFNFATSPAVPSNRQILAIGSATFNWAGTAPVAATGMLTGTSVTDIQIIGLRFTGGNAMLFPFVGKNVRRVWIDRCRSSGGPHTAYLDTTAANYGAVVIDPTSGGFNGNQHIFVTRCQVAGADRATALACVDIRYTDGWEVSDCQFDNVGYGVMFWGGDSNPAVDGAVGNDRKCKRGTVSNVVVTRAVAGVWGSMGQDINVDDPDINDCTDVGLDPEGCLDVAFTGGSVSNCVNGNLATFWFNKGVKFVGISSRVDSNAYQPLRIYNASASAANNDDIVIDACTFRCATGQATISDTSGPFRSGKITNCQFQNVKASFLQNFNNLQITGNTFEFTNDPAAAFTAVDVHGGVLLSGVAGSCKAMNNTILCRFTPTTGTKAINVTSNDANGSSTIDVVGNTFRGFIGAGVYELDITESGANAALSGVFRIDNNDFEGGLYRRTESGAKRAVAFLRGNRLATGALYPSGLVASGVWDIGQESAQLTPASGSPTGWLCTTTAPLFKPLANMP